MKLADYSLALIPQEVADLLDESKQEIADITQDNAKRLFLS